MLILFIQSPPRNFIYLREMTDKNYIFIWKRLESPDAGASWFETVAWKAYMNFSLEKWMFYILLHRMHMEWSLKMNQLKLAL